MKKQQQGFAAIAVVVLLALAAIGGGTYYTKAKKSRSIMSANGTSTAQANHGSGDMNSKATPNAQAQLNASPNSPVSASNAPCGIVVRSTNTDVNIKTVAAADIVAPSPHEPGMLYMMIKGTINNSAREGCKPWRMFEGKGGTAQAYIKMQGKDMWEPAGSVHSITVEDWTKSTTNFSATVNMDSILIGITDYKSKIVFKDENPSGNASASNTFELFLTEFDKQSETSTGR